MHRSGLHDAAAHAGEWAVALEEVALPSPSLPHCVIVPHIAWATRESRSRLLAATAENLRSFAAGNPVHVVS